MPVNHLLLMTLYALIVSTFFAFLWRKTRAQRLRLFLQLFVGLLGGGILLAWLMFPFPSGPPVG